LTAHVIVAGLLTSPWWVPDLTLIGLVLVIIRAPHRWVIFSIVAGLSTAAWAIRSSSPVLLSYLLIGWMTQRIAKQWNAMDLHVQWLFVGVASAALTFGLIWLDNLWSWPVVGLGVMHTAFTVLLVPVVRSLMAKIVGPAPFRA
jgi:hypothetical protein